jgi:hypothetical protein
MIEVLNRYPVVEVVPKSTGRHAALCSVVPELGIRQVFVGWFYHEDFHHVGATKHDPTSIRACDLCSVVCAEQCPSTWRVRSQWMIPVAKHCIVLTRRMYFYAPSLDVLEAGIGCLLSAQVVAAAAKVEKV